MISKEAREAASTIYDAECLLTRCTIENLIQSLLDAQKSESEKVIAELKAQNDPQNTGMTGVLYRQRMEEWKEMCIRDRKELHEALATITELRAACAEKDAALEYVRSLVDTTSKPHRMIVDALSSHGESIMEELARLKADRESGVFSEIKHEVERATRKFPTCPTDPNHAFAVVGEEYGEALKEVLQLTYEPHKSSKESVRKESIQLAAMSIRFLMSLDRYEYAPREQHSQAIAAPPQQGDKAP